MVMLYFSGTGNSKYIAGLFCRQFNSKAYSIEENIDFEELIKQEETIGFCYPVYASRVPRIMREFAVKYTDHLKNKKLIIFCTQVLFSGDGARSFTDIFPRGHVKVIYAEHFLMPNNVCNFFLTPLESEKKVEKYIANAERKMRLVCADIKAGTIKKRGFNIISRILGLIQGVFVPAMEKMARKSVRINDNCTQCGLCIELCPMSNLAGENGKITHKNNCTACYRCINKCPEKAINVFIRGKIKKQYNFIGEIQ